MNKYVICEKCNRHIRKNLLSRHQCNLSEHAIKEIMLKLVK